MLLNIIEEVRLRQAETFEALAESMNVPEECVLLETGSTNIIECIVNSHKMFKSLGLKIKSLILVHLPFMERLLLLTFLQAWPGEIPLLYLDAMRWSEHTCRMLCQMKFHTLLFRIHRIIFLFDMACCRHRKVYITAGVRGVNCCGQLTSVAMQANTLALQIPVFLCKLNYVGVKKSYTFTFSVFSL